MPFTGTFNKFNATTPPRHPCYDDGPSDANSCTDSIGYADWSTDLYAPENTPVRPRIYSPINGSTYTLRIRSVTTSNCAGKSVTVGVHRNGNLVATVSYQHLANVPSFTNGQVVSTGTTLGVLRWWRNCSSYVVSTSGGVHTHTEVGTVSGRACYMFTTATAVAQTRIIGNALPGATASCA